MKLFAFICNVAMFAFTCLVLVTDGMSIKAIYVVFTLLLLLVPVLNMVVLLRSGLFRGRTGSHMNEQSPEEKKSTATPSSISPATKIAALICNILLLGFCCWAFVDQYPHPSDPGFIPYLLIIGLTPVLSALVISLNRVKHG